jgi:hypothetical protein
MRASLVAVVGLHEPVGVGADCLALHWQRDAVACGRAGGAAFA